MKITMDREHLDTSNGTFEGFIGGILIQCLSRKADAMEAAGEAPPRTAFTGFLTQFPQDEEGRFVLEVKMTIAGIDVEPLPIIREIWDRMNEMVYSAARRTVERVIANAADRWTRSIQDEMDEEFASKDNNP